MNKQVFRKVHATALQRGHEAWANAPEGYLMTIAEPSRSLDQNAAMWPILQAFSDQMPWPVNGVMQKISPEEYKDIFTAAFAEETMRVAMGLNGGMVLLGLRTREFGKKKFSEFLEFLHATAAERGIELPEYA